MYMSTMNAKEFYSTAEVAAMLGISRIALFHRIKRGEIQATKVGRNYIIAASDISPLLGNELSEAQKRDIQKAVKRAVSEYKVAFDLLAKE